jgi:hypothetical protein
MRRGSVFFHLFTLGLALGSAACTSAAPAKEKESAEALPAGSVRARERERIQAQQEAEDRRRSTAAAAAAEDDRAGGGFDFGRGPIRRKRTAPAADPVERASTPVAGRGIRIVWEALAVEREQVENPRFGRKPLRGVTPDLKIVLVSQNHPSAAGREQGRAATREKDGAQVAVLKEADLQVLVRGLREAGFYRVAKPTGAVEPQFEDESARGRVTIDVNGESQTLLSMRGQGTSNATKDIPRIYSEAKQAVAALRNQTPTLNVLTAGGQQVPTVVPRKRGERRVLTPEEAAKILDEEPPAKPPAEGDWLPR